MTTVSTTDFKHPQVYLNNDKNSFAYTSSRDRWPHILTGVIDDVHKTIAETAEGEKRDELKKVLEQITALKHDVEHDKPLKELPNVADDIPVYNRLLKENPTSWLQGGWVFVECYLYRELQVYFDQTKNWKSYDIFSRQKEDAFKASSAGVAELATRYKALAEQLDGVTEEAPLKELFKEFSDISLWGNATDLSLLTTMSLEEIKNLQGADVRKKNEEKILVNHIENAWEVLYADSKQNDGSRVDIILDNAGFELYADLSLVLFLLDSKLAKNVILHPKNIPWFVSDVLPIDLVKTINYLKDSDFFPEGREQIDYFVSKLQGYLDDGSLSVRTSAFWTTPHFFWDIYPQGVDGGSQVWEDLKDSALVILKGDLNYRKLTCDAEWPRDTSFHTALGPLGVHDVHILSFRTCKADVVVGLKPGQDKQLEKEWVEQGNSNPLSWCWSGKYAVIEFNDGKKQ